MMQTLMVTHYIKYVFSDMVHFQPKTKRNPISIVISTHLQQQIRKKQTSTSIHHIGIDL